jgi:hypothetical protein
MKFKNLISSLLVEASKKDILTNKLGVKDDQAEALSRIAGPLSVFFAYKILEMYEEEYYDTAERAKEIIRKNQISIQNRMGLVNGSNSFTRERDKMRGIMDWVRVALAGNVKPYQELTFKQLYDESERWHESLGVGDSKFDFNETNDVILDFRKGDEGYYWVDLGVGNCPDEAERMGHCASSRGKLYSLRSFRKIENDHTLNKSHLTASISDDGELLQLKGQKNSKPTNEYHKLIIPLFYFERDNGYFLINSFGYEYNSENDFKLEDLTTDEITKLYSERPALFTRRQEIKLLKSLGLIESTKFDYKFVLNIPVKYTERYIRGEMTNIIDDILVGDTWKFWDNYDYADWKSSIDYHVDENNTNKIINLLRSSEGFDESLSLIDLIEKCDDSDDSYANEIKHAIRSATNDAESDDYANYLYKQLGVAFGEYGNIISMNDEGVTISVDLEQLITDNKIDDEVVDEISERCENEKGIDPECLFDELLGDGYIEKPRFDADDRWYPSIEDNYFNEILNDRLNEI